MSITYKKKTFTEEFLQKQKDWLNLLRNRTLHSSEEKVLWKKFKEGVEEHFKDPNVPRKFHLQHVYNLGIEWDILFLYSKKDIGKTYQLCEYVKEQRDIYPDMKVVYIRNTKEEQKGLSEQLDNPKWPFYYRSDRLWWKNTKFPNRRALTDKQAGFVAYPGGASGFRRWQGGEHENVRVVVWDECNSIAGGLTVRAIKDFQVFMSSIIRDKKGVKAFMFGNHLRASNIFLNALKINSDTCLKVIKSESSTLLYINTGDMYEGIEQQKGLPSQFLTGEESDDLLTNRPKHRGLKNVYDEWYFFDKLQPMKCVVMATRRMTEPDVKLRYLVMYIAKDPSEDSKYGMWIDEYHEFNLKPGYTPISCDQTTLNIFQYVRRVDERVVGRIFRWIRRANIAGRIWYGTNDTFSIWETIVPEIESLARRTDPNKNKKNKK